MKTSEPDDELFDSILGSLLGLASGDALGMPTECLTPAQIAEYYGWVDRFVEPHKNHIHAGMAAGRVTDDTGQTLAIAKAAIGSYGRLTARSAADALLDWADELGSEFERVAGPSTRRALDLLRQGIPPGQAGKNGRTNGAAMRAPIAGMLHPGNVGAAIQTAYIASLPTHGTSIALAGAGAVAGAVAEACRPQTTLESILAAAKDGAMRGAKLGNRIWGVPLEKRIQLAQQIVEDAADEKTALNALYNFVGVDLRVAESVASAFGVIWLAKGDPTRAIILSANIGGDTDTIGAIAGAICGAWTGAAAFPQSWLDILEEVNDLRLRQVTRQLADIISFPET